MPESTQQFTIGKLRFDFEPASGWIRQVRYRDIELMNAAYCGVRDADWGTCAVKASGLQVSDSGEGVSIQLTNEAVGMPFVWKTEITATSAGIDYRILGSATAEMSTRRTGLCVLHPIASLRGSVVNVVRRKGGVQWRAFPDLVIPNAPFEDFERLEFVGLSGEPSLHVAMELTGDQFSTEDQRNWTDRSLKTYCHPQTAGNLYTLKMAEQIDHKISIKVSERGSPSVCGTWVHRPDTMSDARLELLKRNRLSYIAYRLSIDGYRQARQAGLASHLFVDAASPVPSGDWPVASAEDRLVVQSRDWQAASRTLGEWRKWAEDRKITFALGAPGGFVDLNRNRPPLHSDEAVAFSMNASVHSADARSILETPEGARDCVRTAMTMGGNGEVLLGPVQISSPLADELLRRSLIDLLVKTMPPNVRITAFSVDGLDADVWG